MPARCWQDSPDRRRAALPPPAGPLAWRGTTREAPTRAGMARALLSPARADRHLAAGGRRGGAHHLLHVRLPLRHPRPSEGRRDPLHRRQPRPPGQSRRDLRQGCRRHHAAPVAGPAARAARCASASAARASSRRSAGTRRWTLAVSWLAPVRASDPKKLAFFTGRDQSQSLTGWWATSFGTPNYAAHGGFCSVNMAAAGLYTVGGSFWEFGEPDWEHTRYFLLFGVAEDHDSNPIKLGLGKLKARGAKIVAINPVRTGYAAIADEWIGIRPGTDGLFVLALIHELLRLGPGRPRLSRPPDRRRLAGRRRSRHGRRRALRARRARAARSASTRDTGHGRAGRRRRAAAARRHAPTLPDGRGARRCSRCWPSAISIRRYAPEAVRRALRHAGRDHPPHRGRARRRPRSSGRSSSSSPGPTRAGGGMTAFLGRPVAMHAMRGISAHSNGFQTCRALHLLQLLLGSVDVPGGWRYKAPYPRPCPPGPRPAGRPEEIVARQAAARLAARLPARAGGSAARRRRHAGAHRQGVHLGRAAGRPRPAADGDRQRLARRSLPDRGAVPVHGQHGLELGDEPRRDHAHADRQGPGHRRLPHSQDHLRRRLPLRDGGLRRPRPARHDLSRALGLHLAARPADRHRARPRRRDPPAGGDARPRRAAVPGRADRPRRAAAAAGLRPSRRRAALSRRLRRLPRQPRAQARRRPARRLARHQGRRARPRRAQRPASSTPTSRTAASGSTTCRPRSAISSRSTAPISPARASSACVDTAAPITLQLYAEPLQRFRLAAEGHGAVQPPDSHRERIAAHFDPLPFWYRPFEQAAFADGDYPLHAITQRPMPMYHSWGSQNAWLRQILARNFLYMNRRTGGGTRPRRRRLGRGRRARTAAPRRSSG